MGKVFRKQRVEGVEIPGIIHNGNYFYTRLAVYEDGIVSCWDKRDLRQFEEELRRGRVVPSIPIGQSLSIFGLGSYPVRQARWTHNQKSFYQRVLECVRELNPEMTNLYHITQRETEKWRTHRVSQSASPTPCKLGHKIGYELLAGQETNIFYRRDGKVWLTDVTAYADKSLHIGLTGEESYTFEEISALFESGTLTSELSPMEWLMIDGLGELLLDRCDHSVLPWQEKRKEIEELVLMAANEPTAHDRCVDAYHAYLEEPCDWTRDRLRVAYEAVPEHERCYLGDMDNRDMDYQRILFHPNEKREV